MGTTNTVREDVPSVGRIQRIAVEDMDKHLATLEAELSGGGAIELVRGERVVAEVRAPKIVVEPQERVQPPMPDFMARMREIWGDEVLPEGTTTRWIREDRDGHDHD